MPKYLSASILKCLNTKVPKYCMCLNTKVLKYYKCLNTEHSRITLSNYNITSLSESTINTHKLLYEFSPILERDTVFSSSKFDLLRLKELYYKVINLQAIVIICKHLPVLDNEQILILLMSKNEKPEQE